MEEFENKYKIDKERLISYYQRIKRQSKEEDQNELSMGAKFLFNQSIGLSYDNIYDILQYFKNKIMSGKSLLDFAIEWIRAQKIRLEYKKYLSRAQYPQISLTLAIDDCIFRFFLNTNRHLRMLIKEDILEYNFSALYEIFFSRYDTKNLNLEDILVKHMHNVPTHFHGSKKINVDTIILRSALSNLIVKDYEDVLSSRKEEETMKDKQLSQKVKSKEKIIYEFRGSLLERMIKTYCIGKKQIDPREIEKAVSQFLASYLRFGSLYKFAEFKDTTPPLAVPSSLVIINPVIFVTLENSSACIIAFWPIITSNAPSPWKIAAKGRLNGYVKINARIMAITPCIIFSPKIRLKFLFFEYPSDLNIPYS